MGNSGLGLDSLGFGLLGGGNSFQVTGVIPISSTLLEVQFSDSVNAGDPNTVSPSSYTIGELIINSVQLKEGTPSSVLLVTSAQQYQVYTLVVSISLQSAYNVALDPQANSATFTGYSTTPTFSASAQSRTKVQLAFVQPMLNNEFFTNPSSFTLTDLSGTAVPVTSVGANTVGGSTMRCTLTLGSALSPGVPYSITVSSDIVTAADGLQVYPKSSVIVWNEKLLTLSISVSKFSGELRGGLFGNPNGLVFFSPSLTEVHAPNSSIQVDEVDVCTKAYDTYTFPSRLDPPVLFTHGGGLVGNVAGSVLGPTPSPVVLFATFDRLGETHTSLSNKKQDTVATATDSRAIATLTQALDPTKVSYLNNTHWHLYNGAGAAFITALNTAPIPPGPTTIITLEP